MQRTVLGARRTEVFKRITRVDWSGQPLASPENLRDVKTYLIGTILSIVTDRLTSFDKDSTGSGNGSCKNGNGVPDSIKREKLLTS
jgi:hypothetical protein